MGLPCLAWNPALPGQEDREGVAPGTEGTLKRLADLTHNIVSNDFLIMLLYFTDI